MHLDAETLIGPAIALLYLKDGLLMLAPDEAVLVRGWRGRWRAGFGPRDWGLGGRSPWLCSPLRPGQPVLRLRWDAARPTPAPAAAPADVPPELLVLGPWVGLIWLLLFIVLPLGFYAHLGLPFLLATLAELYATIIITLLLVYRRRDALGLSRRSFGVLAFEVLACAPYAANLMRRLSLMRRVDEDLLGAGARLLQGRQLAEMHGECARRIDAELEGLDSDSSRAQALRNARTSFGHEQQ